MNHRYRIASTAATGAASNVALASAAGCTLTGDDGLEILYWMQLTRALDDRILTLFKQGKIPGVIYSQQGHEAISVGAALALGPDDIVAPMHRDLGAYLLRGMAPGRIIAQCMGRLGSPTRGRDVNFHGLSDLSLGIIGFVSHLPQLMPVALGAATSFQYRDEKNVAMTFAGDGSSSEGGFHETLNMASVFKAPFITILENNHYAYSTPLKYQCAIENLAERAAGYNMPGVIVDGNDVLAVWKSAREAVEYARQGNGPSLIECKTMRMRGHAVHDSADYVPPALLEEWAAKDPVKRFTNVLKERGVLEDQIEKEIDDRIQRELEDAVAWAESSPPPDPDSLTEGVFA